MAEEKEQPKKKRSLTKKKKILLILAGIPLLGILFLFILVSYITSDGFFQSQVLPKVNESLGGVVDVSKSKISPLSQVKLSDVSVASSSTNSVPVLQVKEVDLQYDALKLLFSQELVVKKVLVDTPVIHVKTFANNSSNIEFDTPEPGPQKEPSSSSGAPKVSIKDVLIKDATVIIESEQEDGTWATQKIEGFQFSIDELGNGKKGNISIASSISNVAGADKLLASLKGQFAVELSQSLAPVNLTGNLNVGINEGAGQMENLQGVQTAFDLDLKPDALNNLSLVISRDGLQLGSILAKGPFDAEKGEANISLTADNINKTVIDIFTVPMGGQVGESAFSLTVDYKAANKFNNHEISGNLAGRSIQWISNGNSTPITDLLVQFQSQIDTSKSFASIPEFIVSLKENENPILEGSLNNKLDISFNPESPSVSNTKFSLINHGIDIQKWSKAFDPESPLAGLVKSNLTLDSSDNGKNITIDLNTDIEGLSTGDPQSPIHQSQLQLATTAQISEFQNFDAPKLELKVGKPGADILHFSGSASMKQSGEIKLDSSTQLFNQKEADESETMGLSLSTKMSEKEISIENISLSLKPSQTIPDNKLTISGVLPGAENPEFKGKLGVQSAGFDVTRLLAFVNSLSPENKKKKDKKTSTEPQVEPDPVALPFKYLETNVSIAKLVLDKATIDNIQITQTIDNGKVKLFPFMFELYGVPVKTDLFADLSVKGYEYSAKVDLGELPVISLMESFGQEVDSTKHKGLVDFNLGLSGKGITTPNLKNHLKASTKINMDGAAMPISGGFRKFIMLPIATVLRLDPILDGSINSLNVDANFGAGSLDINTFKIASEPFTISTIGSIGLADSVDLTQFKLPVTLSLRRDIADSANFLPSDTPESQKYVPMPDFVSLVKEEGKDFKANIDEARIAQLLLRSAAGLPGETLENAVEIIEDPAGTAKNVIKNVGGLIPGIGSSDDKDSSSKTNSTPKNPVKLIKGLFE